MSALRCAGSGRLGGYVQKNTPQKSAGGSHRLALVVIGASIASLGCAVSEVRWSSYQTEATGR